jgi:RNA polymerase sigma-70 factor (ECF subfamily)
MDRLVGGDSGQWERFVRTISPVVNHVIRQTLSRYGKSPIDAGDLLQDVFVKLCRRDFELLKKYDPARSRLSTWVSVIARNVAIDHLRRRHPVTLSIDDVPASEDAATTGSEPVDIPFDLLPPRQILIMKLLYERDMTVREVARILGIKEQTVRSARHKAIATLRSLFGKKPDQGDVSSI